MKKSFFRNLIRDIKKTLSRFLSIVVIIAVGVAFYAGVRATSPSMKISADTYFNKNNFMDYKLISTLGLTEDDVDEIKKIREVTGVEGAYSVDAVVEKDQRQLVLNINSLPEENAINQIRLLKGRRAETDNEAVVEHRFLENYKLNLGDTIVLKSGDDSSLEDSLKNTEFKIVGTAQSPLYVSEQRQPSSVGNGSVKGFVYILPQVFKSEVYTEVYVRADKPQSQTSLLQNESYNRYNETLEKALEDIGVLRNEVRYAQVIKEGNQKLNEAETELNASKKEAEEKFAEAYRKLDDAKSKVSKGKEELLKNEALFNKKMAEGRKQIQDGKSQIKAGENEINSKRKEIEAGKLQIAVGKKQLQDSETSLIVGKQQAATEISSAMKQEVEKAEELAEANPGNPVYSYKFKAIKELYDKNIKGKDFDSMYTSLKNDNQLGNLKTYFDMEALKNNFDKGAAEISYGRQQLVINENNLLQGEMELNQGAAELEKNKEKITAAEVELNKGKQEGLAKLNSGRKELKDGEKEIATNLEKLKAEEEKANVKIKDGESEIQKNREKLSDIKKPDWYVLGRSKNAGYETYRQDSDRIDSIGKVFPLIFFLVASLVSLTTMTRMVQEKRTEIGTFKALGYSSTAIVSHYLIYALSASILGSILGVFVGFKLFPSLIMNAYATRYDIGEMVVPFNINLALQAALIAILFTAVAAVASALDELREVPASLMRPKPPKSGKTIFLERVNFIWKRMNFTKKVTARNIFRYKQRLFMTVIGIAACAGLMITGFGLKEGIIGATEAQFSSIYKFDMQGTLSKNVNEDEKDSLKEKTLNISNVTDVMFSYSKNASVAMEDNKSQDAYVVVPESKEELNSYINLNKKDEELKLQDEGVVITKKLAKLLNKKAGETIEITLEDKVFQVKISAVTEHYLQHYIYFSPGYYEKLTEDKIMYNSFYGLLKEISEEAEDNTLNALKDLEDINSVEFKSNVHINFTKMSSAINSVIPVLIISAGVLAFVVIYNLTNINISERKRELATIKLLGFFNHELAAYIYRENMILTVLGSLAGIPMGMFFNKFIIGTAETNDILFLQKIHPIYYLISIILTLLFSVIVNLAMYNRFDKIDMIESLKSAE